MPLDIGVGILLSLGVAELFGVSATPYMILFGVAAALLPDIDIVTALFGRWRHREITHYPVVYVPLSMLAGIYLPAPYALLFIIGVYAHLVHDTIGTGWGIAWTWPYSDRRFLFFPDGARKKEMGTMVTWVPEEKPLYAPTGSNTNWIKALYFTPNPVAYIEYGVLILSLVVLVLYIR